MGKRRAKASVPDVGVLPRPWGKWLTHIAFVLTLIVMIARALMSETVRDPFDATGESTAGPRGPGAAVTLLLDALCCLPALLVLIRRVIDREYVIRWAWSHVLLLLVAAWAA